MKPPDMLKLEHRQIGRVLKSLLNISATLSKDKETARLLPKEIDFFSHYLMAHQQKEEQVFFAILQEQLVTMVDNPITQLIKEHQQNQALFKQLQQQIKDYEAAKINPQALASALRQFALYLIQHLRKENYKLVKLYEQRLPANKKIELAERLELFDEQYGLEKKEKYEHLATDLYKQSQKLAA